MSQRYAPPSDPSPERPEWCPLRYQRAGLPRPRKELRVRRDEEGARVGKIVVQSHR